MSEQTISDRLARIVEAKSREVQRLSGSLGLLRARAEAAPPTRSFVSALRASSEVRLLAEIKRRSPSAGAIREAADPVEIGRGYLAGGAAALSVLTDEDFFGGNLEALGRVRAAVPLPLLRKDFVIAPVQVWESRAAGADAILLIVRILDDIRLADLHSLGVELGMDVLVEVHDEDELDRALAMGVELIGINNRDLASFETDLRVSLALAPRVDERVTLVGESGIRTADDVRRLGAVGVNAVLVGESLMREADVRRAAAALVGHARDERRVKSEE